MTNKHWKRAISFHFFMAEIVFFIKGYGGKYQGVIPKKGSESVQYGIAQRCP
jgi:hypothetical protein